MIYFSLSKTINAARFDDSIIILDIKNNKYLSFIGSTANYLSIVLENNFEKINNEYDIISFTKYDAEELNYWINYFLVNNFIVESNSQNRKLISSLPIKKGGLKEYEWKSKTGIKNIFEVSSLEIIKAFFQLARIHKIINKHAFQGIVDSLKKLSQAKDQLVVPTKDQIASLAKAVDIAAFIFPKKTACLAWATTYVALALKRGWDVSLCIGIQTSPFYAHAWAQVEDQVINDDPVIAQVLSIIMKIPNN